MKILLDECVPVRLKQHLVGFNVSTATELDWSGLKNGKLIQMAIDSGFDVLITVDKNLQFQKI